MKECKRNNSVGEEQQFFGMWLKTENTRHGDRLNKEKGDISDGKK